MDVKEQIALSILKGAGGNVDKDYTSTDAIYRDVESIYRAQDNRQDVESLQVELIDNGTYTYDDRNTQGYKPVEINVNVPVDDYYNSGFENGIEIQKAKLEAITITENGIYNKEDGYDEVEVNIDTQSYYDNGYNNGTQDQKSKLESITITENGIYNKEDGYNNVDVNIDTQSFYDNGYNNGYSEGDNNGYERGYGEGVDSGIQEQKAKLESITIESNGTYRKEDGYNKVVVKLDIPKTKIYNGFRFDGTGDNDYQYFKDIDFGLYDWSGVYDTAEFFKNIKSNDGGGLMAHDFDNFVENFNGEMLTCRNMFEGTAIKELPNFGELTKNCLEIGEMLKMSTIMDASNLQYWNISNITDMSNMFVDCNSLTIVPQLSTSNVNNMSSMFKNCSSLTSIPRLDTSNVTDMSYMFQNCVSLNDLSNLHYLNAPKATYLFSNCSSITDVPSVKFDKAEEFNGVFANCSNLKNVGTLELPKANNIGSLFMGCSSLEQAPILLADNVTDANQLFRSCSSLADVSNLQYLNTSNVTDMNNMFRDCSSLTSVPQFNTSNVTNMGNMFRSCSKLTSIPQLDTSNVTNTEYFVGWCDSLTTIPLLDFGKVGRVYYFFGANIMNNIVNLGGFKDLGKHNGSIYGSSNTFLDRVPNLTHESLMNIINNLYDRKTAGYSTLTLNMGSTNLNKLTDEEKAIAINKGWNLS